MKYLYLIIALFFINTVHAQNYPNLVNYNFNDTPTHGIKIITNLPFLTSSQMPTISIKGYDFANSQVIDLTLAYYIYFSGASNDPNNFYFHSATIASSGSYTPRVLLSNESGRVVIFIDDKSYYNRFTVSAYAQGILETSAWFQGWVAIDEALATSNKTIEIPYKNKFKGNVMMPENGIWNAQGNVGIGTTTPNEKLSVNGKIRAKEIKVETANWPDYVFADGYKVEKLEELERYIKANKHLPEMPSAKEVEANGVELGEMVKLQQKKIEELTLLLIEQNKQLQDLAEKNKELVVEKTKNLQQEERIAKLEAFMKIKK
ncbi:hypothetical protein [Pedobacter sp. ASV12]|uniref:hypothetical protein n=1 Tax=Pedobacter sp. ASV12 TaxID=2795120 RepID=UPI0018EC727C|nr:hypothetical protein [Pedobacter sp. ASV12]